jgi:hypothetical protein
MPHLIIEVSRGPLTRKILTIPIDFDASKKPVDILAPPKAHESRHGYATLKLVRLFEGLSTLFSG